MTVDASLFADRTPGEHVASWINYAVMSHRDGLDLDAIILAPRLTQYAREIFRGVEPFGGARPVERPLFPPYDVAVLFHDLPHDPQLIAACLRWSGDRFDDHPGIMYISHRTWAGLCREGWSHDRSALLSEIESTP